MTRPLGITICVIAAMTQAPAEPFDADGSTPPSEHADDFRLRRSPRGAAMRSLLVPGWGQWHTGHHRKALLAAGVELGLASWALYETPIIDRELERSRAAGEDQTMVDAGTASHYDTYIDHFEFRRELLVWLGLSAIGFALDAYVDAWLYGRDEEFDRFPEPRVYTSIGIVPVTRGIGASLRVSWR